MTDLDLPATVVGKLLVAGIGASAGGQLRNAMADERDPIDILFASMGKKNWCRSTKNSIPSTTS